MVFQKSYNLLTEIMATILKQFVESYGIKILFPLAKFESMKF